jgi:hypothetical protein
VPHLPEPDEHTQHGVPESEAKPRVALVRVRARAQPGVHRAAPLAEPEQGDVGVLIGRLRGGLEEPERLRELAMRAERPQRRARAGGRCESRSRHGGARGDRTDETAGPLVGVAAAVGSGREGARREDGGGEAGRI